MKKLHTVAAGCASLFLAACETTGDPHRGGLFGWSETKAKARQAEKSAAVRSADEERERETERSPALKHQRDAGDERVAKAGNDLRQSRALLSAERESALRKVSQLEDASPTAATASRARALRSQIEEIAGDEGSSLDERVRRLRRVAAQIGKSDAEIAR